MTVGVLGGPSVGATYQLPRPPDRRTNSIYQDIEEWLARERAVYSTEEARRGVGSAASELLVGCLIAGSDVGSP